MKRIYQQLSFFIVFCVLSVLGTQAFAAPTADQKRRLSLQHQLDHNVPLVDSTWIGTHNSFNASNAGYPLPNQTYTMIDQLDAGFRVLSYDTYYQYDKVRLCHGECSALDQTLFSALEDLAQWLNAHPNDVVMIIIQDGIKTTTGQNLAVQNIENRIGHLVYRPEDHNPQYKDGFCRNLPLRKVSKQDVLNAGRQVILTSYEGCGVKSDWRKLVWNLPNLGYVADSYEKADSLRLYNAMSLVYEDRSVWGAELQCTMDLVENWDKFIGSILGLNKSYDPAECFDSWWLNGSELKDALRKGIGIVGLDFGVEVNRHEDLIWSWKANQPDGGTSANCAVQDVYGFWRDTSCQNTKRFACQSTVNGDWVVSEQSGPWHNGDSVCAAMGDYMFAAPVNAMENLELRYQRLNVSATVWLNASDEQQEDLWQVHKHFYDAERGLIDGSSPNMSNRVYSKQFEVGDQMAAVSTGLLPSLDFGVILSPPSYNDTSAGVLRINIPPITQAKYVNERFISFEEWDYSTNKSHGTEAFDLLNLSMGVREMEDGSIWEVGRFEVDGNKDFTTVPFLYEFSSSPYLFLTIQFEDQNNVVTVRAKDITTESFQAALFEQEANTGNHPKVSVTYLAIQSDATQTTTIMAGGFPLQYRVLSDTLDENFKTIGQFEYMLQEEQSKDNETAHTMEQVHVLEINNTAFAQQVSSNGVDTTAIRRR